MGDLVSKPALIVGRQVRQELLPCGLKVRQVQAIIFTCRDRLSRCASTTGMQQMDVHMLLYGTSPVLEFEGHFPGEKLVSP